MGYGRRADVDSVIALKWYFRARCTIALLVVTASSVITTRDPLAQPPGYSFTVIATLGEPAPGGGVHKGDFEPGDINNRGDVGFASDLAESINEDVFGEGLYARYSGMTRLIARTGDSIPGIQLKYGEGILSPPGMNDAGDIAFGFLIDVDSGLFQTRAAVFRYDSVKDVVTPVFLPGAPAPGGTIFRGSDFHTDLNNGGQIATVAVIDTADGNCTDQAAPCYGLGRGVYVFDRFNRAAKIAAPGDPAPASNPPSTLDDAWDPNLNNNGGVVFGGHVKGEPCVSGNASTLGCFESLYLYQAGTGRVTSIVHQGSAAPGGGVFAFAFNGRLNEVGDASFIGGFKEDLSENGVFLRKRNGTIVKVARVGDPLPGGTMKNTTQPPGSHAIDNAGDVAFSAVLNADSNGDGIDDSGVYLWSGGVIREVVKTGTAILGHGTVLHVNNAYYVGATPANAWPEIHMNQRGQILTQVITDTGNYVIIATPNSTN